MVLDLKGNFRIEEVINIFFSRYIHKLRYLVSARKHQFLRYACQKNAHPTAVGLHAFSAFASLELDVFLSNTEFSCKHYLKDCHSYKKEFGDKYLKENSKNTIER
jgi:hypothetical protein